MLPTASVQPSIDSTMAILELTDQDVSNILHATLTPSKEIDDPHRLFGRDRSLKLIERAFNSEGRHVFIYGDRGVGKTSLAKTAARLHHIEGEDPIYVPCAAGLSFGDIMQSVGRSRLEVARRLANSPVSGEMNLGYEGLKVGGKLSGNLPADIPKPSNLSEALDIIRFIANKSVGQQIIIVDEFDRLEDASEKILFAEMLKNTSAITTKVRFIFCGIGRNVDEVLGAHHSAGRYFEAIELEKLHHNFLWQILRNAADDLGVKIPDGVLTRIGIVSDGFPHFVHLIGECMFWAMHDDPERVETCSRKHYEEAIKGALQRAEPTLRLTYQKATEKTKHTTEYEEALWALADKSETRRQLTDIYEGSYKRIMFQRPEDRIILERDKFNQRLLNLRKETHQFIVVGHGAGWFSFAENQMRGYVRLKAENAGIELKPDTT